MHVNGVLVHMPGCPWPQSSQHAHCAGSITMLAHVALGAMVLCAMRAMLGAMGLRKSGCSEDVFALICAACNLASAPCTGRASTPR